MIKYTLLAISIMFSALVMADESDTTIYDYYAPITDSMKEVSAMSFLGTNEDTFEPDDYTRIFQDKYLMVSKRKFRQNDFLRINRNGAQVYRTDIKVCNQNTGCYGFPFKIYEFQGHWHDVRDAIRQLDEAEAEAETSS